MYVLLIMGPKWKLEIIWMTKRSNKPKSYKFHFLIFLVFFIKFLSPKYFKSPFFVPVFYFAWTLFY